MRISAPLVSEPKPILQRIEIASSFSIPSFHLIGLASPEVAEARERVRAAIEASGFEFPRRRVVANLSPASIRKRGTGIDLAIALAILANAEESQATPSDRAESRFEVVAWGELGLDGKVKPTGKLMRGLSAAWEAQSTLLFVSEEEFSEAEEALSLLTETQDYIGNPPCLFGVENLREAWSELQSIKLNGRTRKVRSKSHLSLQKTQKPTLSDPSLLPLSPITERILGVAASGGHHLLLLGPKGSGKSHALDWFVALQPPATPRTKVEQQLIRELSGVQNPLHGTKAPVRRVGIQCRPGALLGGMTGGSTLNTIRPGELSLAHGGLLIADEFPEWARDSRETLREPLERGFITLTRASGSVELPARFVIAANGNLCPCGGYPAEFGPPPDPSPPLCDCHESARRQYLNRLSGPLLDRLDMAALIGLESVDKPIASPQQTAQILQQRCMRAREFAETRWGKPAGQLNSGELEKLLSQNPSWHAPLETDCSSLRDRHKRLRIALSLFAWDESLARSRTEDPKKSHFIEAKAYRPERLLMRLKK